MQWEQKKKKEISYGAVFFRIFGSRSTLYDLLIRVSLMAVIAAPLLFKFVYAPNKMKRF